MTYENFYQNHEDAEVREKSFRSFSEGLRQHQNTAAATYLAQVKGMMTQEDVETFAKGIPLKDFTCQPARLDLVSVDSEKESEPNPCDYCRREVSSGQAYVAYCGKEVVDLQRLTMGTLILDENLQRGEWRRLTKEELENLLASIA